MFIDISTVLHEKAAAQRREAALSGMGSALSAYRAKDFAAQVADRSFGSDGPYSSPRVGQLRERELWHIHLQPALKDPRRSAWDAAIRNGRDKSSDQHLIYARRDADLLLIALLNKDAHRVAQMRTKADRELMEDFARLAGQWRANRLAFSDWVQIVP